MELTTLTLLMDTSGLATLTVEPARKLTPLTVTPTLVPRTPLDGLIELRVTGAAVMVNDSGPLVPLEVVTVTFEAPVAAPAEIANVALIWVSLTTLTLVTVTIEPPIPFEAE